MFYFSPHRGQRRLYCDRSVTLNTDISITTNRCSSTMAIKCHPLEELLGEVNFLTQYQSNTFHSTWRQRVCTEYEGETFTSHHYSSQHMPFGASCQYIFTSAAWPSACSPGHTRGHRPPSPFHHPPPRPSRGQLSLPLDALPHCLPWVRTLKRLLCSFR